MTPPVSIIHTSDTAATASPEGKAPAEAPEGALFAVPAAEGGGDAGETAASDAAIAAATPLDAADDAEANPDMPEPVKVLLEQDSAAKPKDSTLFEINPEAVASVDTETAQTLPDVAMQALDPEAQGEDPLELLELATPAKPAPEAAVKMAAASGAAVAPSIVAPVIAAEDTETVSEDEAPTTDLDVVLAATKLDPTKADAEDSDLEAPIAKAVAAETTPETSVMAAIPPREVNEAKPAVTPLVTEGADPKANAGGTPQRSEIALKPAAPVAVEDDNAEMPVLAEGLEEILTTQAAKIEQIQAPLQGAAAALPETQPMAVAAAAQAPQAIPMSQNVSAPLAMSRPDWPVQLVQEIGLRQFDDGAELEITLTPERLGTLQVKMEMRDGVANIAIVTETPEAARLFNDNQQRLAEQFSRIGLELGNHSAGTNAQQNDTRDGNAGTQGNGSGDPASDLTELALQSVPLGQQPRVDILA